MACAVVCQIIARLEWEQEFRCEGVANLAEFKAFVDEVNAIDPPYQAFRRPVDPDHPEDVKAAVFEFLRRPGGKPTIQSPLSPKKKTPLERRRLLRECVRCIIRPEA